MLERLAPYPISRMVLLEDQTAEVDCNWKAIIDSFSELYHVDYIHPQHKSFVDCTGAHTLHATSDGTKAVQAERVPHDRFH